MIPKYLNCRPHLRLNPGADDLLATPSPLTVHDTSSSPAAPACCSCPPRGGCAHSLTLLLATAAVFLSAWTILGPIAAPGGTVFALLVLIVLALIGGQVVKLTGVLLSKVLRVNISLPPLLGMLVVGIALKNVPYNVGQFGRAECTAGHGNASFIDSIHDLDSLEEHGSFKRSIPDAVIANYHSWVQKRSIEDVDMDGNASGLGCTPRYIGHELDPLIARQLRTLCLAVILIRAGLEMDPVALYRLSGMVLR